MIAWIPSMFARRIHFELSTVQTTGRRLSSRAERTELRVTINRFRRISSAPLSIADAIIRRVVMSFLAVCRGSNRAPVQIPASICLMKASAFKLKLTTTTRERNSNSLMD